MARRPISDVRAGRLLRSALTCALVVFISVILIVSDLPHNSNSSASAVTTSSTDSHGGTTTPTTPVVVNPFIPTIPVTAAHTDVSPSRGCGFAIDNVAVRTKVSTKKVVPTLPRRPIGRCHVLLVGDSLGEDIGSGVGHELASTVRITFWNRARVSSGLVVRSFYNWPAELKVMLREDRPNLVIICLGGNDEEGIYTHGRAAPFGSALWKTVYAERVDAMIAESRRAGALVLWVGMPIMQQHQYDNGILTLDKLYLQQVERFPGATFLSIYELLATPQGRFQSAASVNRRWESIRTPDGIHLTFGAEQVVGTYVVRTMAALYHVPIHPHGPTVISG